MAYAASLRRVIQKSAELSTVLQVMEEVDEPPWLV
jgi:hypothetical protein